MTDLLDAVRVTVGIAMHRLADVVIGRRLLVAADRVYHPYCAPVSDYPIEPEPGQRRTW